MQLIREQNDNPIQCVWRENIPNVNVETLIGHSSPIAGIAHCNLSL